jgi:hypothetical protein
MGIDMTDLEMIKKCAEKMGYKFFVSSYGETCVEWPSDEEGAIQYVPLYDDAQAMALVKRFNLSMIKLNNWLVNNAPNQKDAIINKDLNRAIVECVARLP